jgi:hypothetical protein
MKTTSIKYCSCCLTDFSAGEIVYFVIIDNNCVCNKCAQQVDAEMERREAQC